MMGRHNGPAAGGLVMLLFLTATAAAETVYTKLSVNADPSWDRVRVFLDAKSSPGYKHITYLSNPARVQVDVEGRIEGIDEGVTSCEDSYLRSIRLERIGTNRVRLTLLLASPTTGAKVDFYRNNVQTFVHIDINRPPRYQQPTWTTSEVNSASRRGVPVVVIDPGHGGYDNGASSRLRRSLKEKDVVLDVAKKVARLLKASGKVYPVMTRSGDCYPTLDERVDLVGSTGAQLLVSIHADSAPNKSASGFAVWILESDRNDVKSEAQRLLKYGWRTQLSKYPLSKQKLAISRQADFVEEENQKAAEAVLASLDRGIQSAAPGFENRGVKRDNFKVLRQYFAPSMLIELGFLSNLGDSRQLDKGWFREKMAAAIAEGIETYFTEHRRGPGGAAPLTAPPQLVRASGQSSGTFSSPKSGTGSDPLPRNDAPGETIEHVVKRGDTLGRLSKQYGVEIGEILTASGLPSKRKYLYPGDTLKIPVSGDKQVADSGSNALGIYEVKDDDNLLTIALRFDTTIHDLRVLNGWPTNRVPRAGEVIKVPRADAKTGKSGSLGVQTLETMDRLWSKEARSGLSPHTQEISSTETVLQEDRESTYYVQAGDTLTSIAAKIGAGAGDLRRENGLQSDLIRVGQGLKVPPHQTETAAAEEDASTDQIADVLPDSEEQTY